MVEAARRAVAEVEGRRLLAAAAVVGERTAVGEDAAGKVGARRRQEAGNGVEPAVVLPLPAPRNAAEQADRVRVARVVEQRPRRAFLDQLPRVEHSDAVAHLRDDGEVVRDEEDARPELLAEVQDELEHLRLDGRVEAGGRLVQDQERRILGERHGDDDPLLHAARELVRIALHHRGRVGDPHLPQHLDAPVPGFAAVRASDRVDLPELLPDPYRGVERPAGILVHHRDARRAQLAQVGCAHGEHVPAGDADAALADTPVSRQVADDGERRRRLAASRLAHEAVALALADVEGEPAQHLAVVTADPVGDVEVDDVESVRRPGRAHRSTTAWIPSATRFTATARDAIASAGKRVGHQMLPEMRP